MQIKFKKIDPSSWSIQTGSSLEPYVNTLVYECYEVVGGYVAHSQDIRYGELG